MLKKYMLAGLAALAPLLISIFLINWLIGLSEKFSAWLPEPYRLQNLLCINLPGFDFIMAIMFMILFGAATVHIIGNNLMKWFDGTYPCSWKHSKGNTPALCGNLWRRPSRI
ncbi:MAG: hypothetical protein R8M14_09170 [Ghiorsea sp.]